jgi:hypothetical protein
MLIFYEKKTFRSICPAAKSAIPLAKRKPESDFIRGGICSPLGLVGSLSYGLAGIPALPLVPQSRQRKFNAFRQFPVNLFRKW